MVATLIHSPLQTYVAAENDHFSELSTSRVERAKALVNSTRDLALFDSKLSSEPKAWSTRLEKVESISSQLEIIVWKKNQLI